MNKTDLISRSGLKKQLETMVGNCKTLKLWGGSISQRVADIAEKVLALCIRAVDEAAAVDAVPVVRCKDCKSYRYDEDFERTMCGISIMGTDSEHFCSYGERKDNATD